MIPLQKLKAMILYFATNTDPNLLGKVKLMKLFYFVDFAHVKKYASPITFDNYVHLEHGPIPSTILNLVNELENDPDNAILADSIRVEKKDDSYLKRVVSTRKFTDKDEKYFTKNELDVMKDVCSRFFDKNAKSIEDASHKESAWSQTIELQSIPYTLAANDPDSSVAKEDIQLASNVFSE